MWRRPHGSRKARLVPAALPLSKVSPWAQWGRVDWAGGIVARPEDGAGGKAFTMKKRAQYGGQCRTIQRHSGREGRQRFWVERLDTFR